MGGLRGFERMCRFRFSSYAVENLRPGHIFFVSDPERGILIMIQ